MEKYKDRVFKTLLILSALLITAVIFDVKGCNDTRTLAVQNSEYRAVIDSQRTEVVFRDNKIIKLQDQATKDSAAISRYAIAFDQVNSYLDKVVQVIREVKK